MNERRKYQIRMNQPGPKFVDLIDILSLIKSPALVWRMTFLDAIGRPGNSLNYLQLEQQVRDSEQGVQFSQSELQSVAEQLNQVVDTDLAGFLEAPGAPQGEAVAMVEAFDSSEWNLVFDESEVELDHELLAALNATLQSD